MTHYLVAEGTLSVMQCCHIHPFIVQLFKSHNCCSILKLEYMDEDGCYVELYFYDKLTSLRPSDMSDLAVKHVRGTRFGSVRRE
jgi:hypothetical protein